MTRSSHGSVVILSSTVGICGDKSKERLCDEYGLPVYIYMYALSMPVPLKLVRQFSVE